MNDKADLQVKMEACVDTREQSSAEAQQLLLEKTDVLYELASQKEIYIALEREFVSLSKKVSEPWKQLRLSTNVYPVVANSIEGESGSTVIHNILDIFVGFYHLPY